ncbi:MAG TPA: isoprenylcysteine carboxylmethyltransferase family protein [Chloroflexota bacterium]
MLSAAVEMAVLIGAAPRPSWRWAAAGFGFAASLACFGRCIAINRARPLTLAFANDIPAHLVRTGPYRVIRHPFYTSYMLAYIAGLIATASPLLIPVIVCMGSLYTRAASKEEAKFAARALRNEYAAYCRRTGRFTPRLRLDDVRDNRTR